MKTLAAALAFLPFGLCAQSAWVPYTANLQQTIERVDAQGRSLGIEVLTTGSVQRWADGSELTRKTDRDGSSDQHLRVAATRTSYLLNDNSKRAVKRDLLPASFQHHPNYTATSSAGPERVIGGLTCTTFQLPTGGSQCVMTGNELVLQREVEVVGRAGARTIWREELTDVKLGVEPPLAELRLPAGYQIVSPASAAR